MKAVDAQWEQRNLGVNSWELTVEPGDGPAAFDEAEKRALAAGAAYLVVKTPCGMPEFLYGLPARGYVFAEAALALALTRAEWQRTGGGGAGNGAADAAAGARGDAAASASAGTACAESAAEKCGPLSLVPADAAARAAAAQRVEEGLFRTDRISLDPAFTPRQAAHRYACWLADIAQQGGTVYEVRTAAGEAAGFAALQGAAPGERHLTLYGVYPAFQGRGAGTALLRAAARGTFAAGFAVLTTVVVSSNPASLRALQRAGFVQTGMQYVYVRHV